MSDGKYLDRPGFRWLVNKLKNTFRKIGSIIPISEGGTGATNSADAREALGVKEFRGVSGSIQSMSGLLPGAPADGEDKVFYGNGEWDYIKEFRGVSGSILSMSGLLPGAPVGGEDMVFYGRGEWGTVQGGGGHDDLIAPVESASGSEHVYAIGDQFIIEGVLYIATAAIAIGDAFVVGTNCAINQSITEQIKNIVDSYVTGIKGNAESSYRKGNVNLTPENIGAVPLSTSSGIGAMSGAGQYSWCWIARLTITGAYCNGPIAFELSQRQDPVSLVQVCFASSSGTDPDLNYFTTNYSNRYYIKKADTSTWDLYANYTETWGAVALHRITGFRNGNGVSVTVKMENCAAPSSPTQVTYGGNVGYAASAGSATDSTKVAKAGDSMTGTLSVTANSGSDTPINLKSRTAKCYIGFQNSSGTVLGYYGVNDSKLPVFYSGGDKRIYCSLDTIPISNGGTGATTRLGAAQNLANENVGTGAQYFVTLTQNWGKFGYSSAANARSAMGLGNTTGVLPIANGGTGTNSASGARQTLGIFLNTARVLKTLTDSTTEKSWKATEDCYVHCSSVAGGAAGNYNVKIDNVVVGTWGYATVRNQNNTGATKASSGTWCGFLKKNQTISTDAQYFSLKAIALTT